MTTHSRILAWKLLWTEEPDGIQSIGSQRVEHDWECTQALQMASQRKIILLDKRWSKKLTIRYFKVSISVFFSTVTVFTITIYTELQDIFFITSWGNSVSVEQPFPFFSHPSPWQPLISFLPPSIYYPRYFV